MSRTGPVTRDTSTVQLGLSQIRVGRSAPNIATVTPVLLAADSMGAMASTSYTGETEYWELESGFPLGNDVVYVWALKPITDGYIWVVPREMRLTFANFFFNLAMPIRLLNALFQADFEGAGIVLGRFTINTTLGIYGLADVAAVEFDIQPRTADFGQTLGKWGVGEGIYFCWPIFGPSSVRDSLGMLVDAYTHPIPYFHESRALDAAYYFSERINALSLNPDLYEDLKRFSLDPYVASRHAFVQYRRAFIEKE